MTGNDTPKRLETVVASVNFVVHQWQNTLLASGAMIYGAAVSMLYRDNYQLEGAEASIRRWKMVFFSRKFYNDSDDE
jgi:hypothetical protein